MPSPTEQERDEGRKQGIAQERQRCGDLVARRMGVITGQTERDKSERAMLSMLLELIRTGA